MPIDLGQRDHERLGITLDSILTSHANGEIPLVAARAVLEQIVTAAASDNGDELRDWLEPARLARWREELGRHAPGG